MSKKNNDTELTIPSIGIPGELSFNPLLSETAKLLFGHINNMAKRREGCTASNIYLSNQIFKSERTVADYIKELEKWGYLDVILTKNDDSIYSEVKRNIFISDQFKTTYKEAIFIWNEKRESKSLKKDLSDFFENSLKNQKDAKFLQDNAKFLQDNAKFLQDNAKFLQDNAKSLKDDAKSAELLLIIEELNKELKKKLKNKENFFSENPVDDNLIDDCSIKNKFEQLQKDNPSITQEEIIPQNIIQLTMEIMEIQKHNYPTIIRDDNIAQKIKTASKNLHDLMKTKNFKEAFPSADALEAQIRPALIYAVENDKFWMKHLKSFNTLDKIMPESGEMKIVDICSAYHSNQKNPSNKKFDHSLLFPQIESVFKENKINLRIPRGKNPDFEKGLSDIEDFRIKTISQYHNENLQKGYSCLSKIIQSLINIHMEIKGRDNLTWEIFSTTSEIFKEMIEAHSQYFEVDLKIITNQQGDC